MRPAEGRDRTQTHPVDRKSAKIGCRSAFLATDELSIDEARRREHEFQVREHPFTTSRHVP